MTDHRAAKKMARECLADTDLQQCVDPVGVLLRQRERGIAAAYLELRSLLHSMRPCDSDHEEHCSQSGAIRGSPCDCVYGEIRARIDAVLP